MTTNSILLLVAMFAAAMASCNGKTSDVVVGDGSMQPDGTAEGEPTLDGWCGLRGQKVWCNVHSECAGNINGPDCSWSGYCYPDYPYCWSHPIHGDFEPGSDCAFASPLTVCDGTDCTRRCLTHSDCGGVGYCRCDDRFFGCMYKRCQSDACPEGYEEVPNSLRCAPLPETLEGDCHGYNGVCPTGYEPVGSSGCATTMGEGT